jgi:hypothetical protein
LEKRAVSIFRAAVMNWNPKEIIYIYGGKKVSLKERANRDEFGTD